jgi:phosphoesterase RecJ-like protein
MELLHKEIKEFRKIIKKNQTFFMTVHLNPDADAIGSMLSVALYLENLGKKIFLYSHDVLNENLLILPGAKKIKYKTTSKAFDVGIFFECSTPERGGNEIKEISFKKTISIDHHKTAKRYADLNILDFKSPSTSEIIFRIFKRIGFKMDKNIAKLLYAGIVTDTGRFHYPQTTPQTHIIAGELLKYKFDFTKLNDNFFVRTTYQNIKLLARAIERMKIYYQKFAMLVLREKDFREFKAGFEHTENIVNYPMMIDEVKVSCLIKEDREKFSVTFRSKGNIDVSEIALFFGGGGHKSASGFKVSKNKIDIETLKKSILKEIKKYI